MILESNVWELYFSFVGKNTPLKERLGLESIDMVSGTWISDGVSVLYLPFIIFPCI